MRLSEQEQDWITAIRKSGRFDRDFYRRWYGDDPEVRGELEQHYISAGESRGYWPCPGFSPESYLDSNPDVATAGVSPFFHYVTNGEREGRVIRAVPEFLRFGGGIPEIPETAAGTSRFAVVVHVFHWEMWPELARRIRSLGDSCDLFVTITRRPGQEPDTLIETIQNDFPAASVFPFPNHGRDIFPFSRLVNAGVLDRYEAVCKIHTKRSPHLETGKAWNDHLIDSLLPGPEKNGDLAERFLSAGECGVLTADGQRKSGPEWWHENRGRSLNLLARAGIRADPSELCFPAGSMYWLKPPVIEAFRGLNLKTEDFDPELGQGDGTTAHAIERIFGYLAESRGLKVLEVGEISGQTGMPEVRETYEFCEPETRPVPAGQIGESISSQTWRPPVSRHVRYEGALESCGLRGAAGWIRELSDRDLPCRVRLIIDGTVIIESFADHYRADLGGREDNRAWCGFFLPIPDPCFDGQSHGFQIEVLGEGWNWQSLLISRHLARKEEIGEVNGINDGIVRGHCRDPQDPGFRQELDLLIDGYFAGGTEFSDHDDGETGTGEFSLEIPDSFRDGDTHQIRVLVRGSRICLWEGTERL